MPNRYLRNLFTTSWALRRAFPRQLLHDIERAVAGIGEAAQWGTAIRY